MKTKKVRKSLHRLMIEHLDQEELKTISFYLGEEYSSLNGQGKAAKARELIASCQRKGRVKDLLQELIELRSHVDWPLSKHVSVTKDRFFSKILEQIITWTRAGI